MSDYPMLISNKLHSFRNFKVQIYEINHKKPPRLKFADDSGTGLTKAPELNKPLNRQGKACFSRPSLRLSSGITHRHVLPLS